MIFVVIKDNTSGVEMGAAGIFLCDRTLDDNKVFEGIGN